TLLRRIKAAVQINRGDQRLKDVRQQIGRHVELRVHPFTEKKEVTEVQLFANLRADAATDHGRLDLGHLAFLVLRVAEVKLLAADQSQDRVTQEFHALIGRKAGIRAGRMSKSRPEEVRLEEAVTYGVL